MKSFLDSKVCDQQRPYHHLKRQMTRFEWYYHFNTKSQHIFWKKKTSKGSELKNTHHHPACVCVYFSEPMIKVQYGDYQSDVRDFSNRNFRKTDALSALKCGLFTFPFYVICLKNGSFWGVSCPLNAMICTISFIFSLMMELWLLRNVEFYCWFLQFYDLSNFF